MEGEEGEGVGKKGGGCPVFFTRVDLSILSITHALVG